MLHICHMPRINVKRVLGVLAFSSGALLSMLFVNIAYNVPFYESVGWFWALLIFVIMCNQISHIEADCRVKKVLYLRVMIGLVLAIIMTIRFNDGIFDSDEGTLLSGSIGYFKADFTGEFFYDSYSFLAPAYRKTMLGMFSFFGINSICIRIMFLYLWFLGYRLIEKMANQIRSREYVILTAFYALMPWEILIGARVLREPLICISLMLSMYYLWKWMKTGWIQNIILASIMPVYAVLLHAGNIAMLGVVFITYVLWDYKKQRWRLVYIKKKHFILIAVLLILPFAFDIAHALNLDRFADVNSFSDVFSKVQDMAMAYNEDANTFYIRPFDLSSPIQVVAMILYRSLYFWISPSPMFWTSPTHAVAFVADSCVWIVFFIYMIRNVCVKRINRMGGVFIPIVLFFTFIYGLGTNTGGTAMRHRGQLLGVLVMCAVLVSRDKKLEDSVCEYEK